MKKILIFSALALASCTKYTVLKKTRVCRIEKIEERPTTISALPDRVYTLHTDCGKIPAQRNHFQVGDEITVQFIYFKK